MAEPVYVGFWARFLAFIVDSIWASIIVGLIVGAIYGPQTLDVQTATVEELQRMMTDAVPQLGLQIVLVGVAFVLFWMFRSATPGKMIVSAIIVDAETLKAPSTGQLIARYLSYYLSIVLFGLGFLWIAFDPRKQGWHDKIAGTVVVKKGSV